MKAITFITSKIQQSLIFRLYKYVIIDSVLIIKNHGFRELARRRGKRFFYAIIGYYTVRDTLIYLVIPFCFAKGLL